jgi:hypothetical protein
LVKQIDDIETPNVKIRFNKLFSNSTYEEGDEMIISKDLFLLSKLTMLRYLK